MEKIDTKHSDILPEIKEGLKLPLPAPSPLLKYVRDLLCCWRCAPVVSNMCDCMASAAAPLMQKEPSCTGL